MNAIRPLVLAAAIVATGCANQQTDAEYQQSLDDLKVELDEAVWEKSDPADVEASQDDELLREMVDRVLALAQVQPCSVEGGLMGLYDYNELSIVAVNDHQLVGLIDGTIVDPDVDTVLPMSDAEVWEGTYVTSGGDTGLVTGFVIPDEEPVYAPIPPLPETEPASAAMIGTVNGMLGNSETPEMGHVFGVLAEGPEGDALFLGGYAVCEAHE